MGKRKYYFPPKQTAPVHRKDDITVSDDVKEKLMEMAEQFVDQKTEERRHEDLNNYIAFSLEALSRLGWTGKTRLNRFLATLTAVSEEAANADDPTAYADDIKKRMTDKGVSAFMKSDDTEGVSE